MGMVLWYHTGKLPGRYKGFVQAELISLYVPGYLIRIARAVRIARLLLQGDAVRYQAFCQSMPAGHRFWQHMAQSTY